MRKMMLLLGCAWYSFSIQASTYPLPVAGNVIGQIIEIKAKGGESLFEIAKQHDISVRDLKKANPFLKKNRLSRGDTIKIPSQFILPDGPREGVVINISEARLYYYHPDASLVSTYPIGIGQLGWATPVAKTTVTQKIESPAWHVPESIRQKAAAEGKTLPLVVPPGPDNPLGDYAIRLNLPGYLIHGTRNAKSIGERASHGCIRMWDHNVKAFFNLVTVNTPVQIIHQPYKIGIDGDTILLESHQPLEEQIAEEDSQLSAIAMTVSRLLKATVFQINWDKAQSIAERADGVPTPIGNHDIGTHCPFC